jgi:hypothetical protein
MKLKDIDIKELNDLFEEALNRSQRLDKQQRIHLRKKIRSELFSLLAWDLATVPGILSRWEERLSDVFAALPFGFKEEISSLLTEKLRSPLLGRTGKDGLDALHRHRTPSD